MLGNMLQQANILQSQGYFYAVDHNQAFVPSVINNSTLSHGSLDIFYSAQFHESFYTRCLKSPIAFSHSHNGS